MAPGRGLLGGTAADPSVAHLLGRLAVVERRVAAHVGRLAARDASPAPAFRGIILTAADVTALLQPTGQPPVGDDGCAMLAAVEADADAAEASGARLRLRRLAGAFGLDELDTELLMVALAPDLDARFETLFAYLQNDVSRPRPSVGLALELCARAAIDADARERLSDGGPLVASGLLEVRDRDRPFLSRPLVVHERVVTHLLGGDRRDAAVEQVIADVAPYLAASAERLGRTIVGGARLTYIREGYGASGRAWASAALASVGLGSLAVDFRRAAPGEDLDALAGACVLEAKLAGVALVAGPVEALDGAPRALARLARADWVVVLTGRRTWLPPGGCPLPLVVDAPTANPSSWAALWRAALDGELADDVDVDALVMPFRFEPERVPLALDAAQHRARLEGRGLDASDVRYGARIQGMGNLASLATRIEPAVGWDDLVLPASVINQLRAVAARVRHRHLVLGQWGLRPGHRGRGMAAMFSGPSGTGKTMSAEVIANDLGLDLYTVDLSSVVDKYIGETEKKLERLFDEAEASNAVLFFDEADALFGKRSEVSDARDRYANIEVAYLLQRLEAFDGTVILATNLSSNIDDAFLRRLDDLIAFPLPDEHARLALWERCVGDLVPRRDDVDLRWCATQFAMSGGNIRNAAITAAYLAAASGPPLCMEDLVVGIALEYRKLGHLRSRAEFGDWLEVVNARVG